ncbi:MAG: DUF4384 domain-containing protein [Rhodospirillales bacterium]|nr:DUF4384 domain-containing protein [Rhodospirillales bacterium]
MEDSTSRKIAVYIATTGGPVRVERITQEPAPQSVVCLRRSSEVLPISGDYDDFVKPGSGVIVREFGPFEDNAFRLDLSGSISAGKSWQFGVFIAHALDAAQGYALAESDDEAEEIFWLTGLVDYDLNLGPVNHIPEKLEASQLSFETWKASGKNITLCLSQKQNSEEIPALPGIEVLGLNNAMELLTVKGIYSAASSSDVIAVEPIPVTPPPPKKKSYKIWWWLIGGIALAGFIYQGYLMSLALMGVSTRGAAPIKTVQLPAPPLTSKTTPTPTSPKLERKGPEKKIYSLAESLISGIERSRKALVEKGDKYQYNDPPRVVLWPFGQDNFSLNPRAEKKLNDRLVSALLEMGSGEFTFMARDELKTIIEDMEATGALDDQGGKDPIAALLKDASNIDIMIKGSAVTDGDASLISFKAVRMDGVILAQTEPKRFKIKLRKRQQAAVKADPKIGSFTLRMRAERELYRVGEKLNLKLKLTKNAWVYCFYDQANGEIVQIFPNPPFWKSHKEPLLLGSRDYTIPGETVFPFDLIVSLPLGQEKIICYAADRNVTDTLPGELQGRSLDPIPNHTTSGIEAIFQGLPGTKVTRSDIEITVSE